MPLAIDKLMPNKWLNDNEEGGKNQYEEQFLQRLMTSSGKNYKYTFDKLVRPEAGRKLIDNIQRIYDADFSVTGAGTTATVVPEKGGMVTSFTKNGDEYSWLREPNFSQPERPRCAMPVLFPMCGRAPQDANTFGGKSYPMIIHGIVHSRQEPPVIAERGAAEPAKDAG